MAVGTYLVTGATSGIGALVARTLHDRGDRLVLTARSEERAATLREEFADASVLVADLADADAVRRLGGDLPDELHGVVHSAGTVEVASVEDATTDGLVGTITVNLIAPMLLTQAVLGPVRRARGTHVFLNSGSGLQAKGEWAAYNASKFGLRGFADALREEEQPHGVRVSSVYPGRTATRMQERVHAQEAKDYDPDAWIRPETIAGEVVRLLDLGRDATVPDVVIRPVPR